MITIRFFSLIREAIGCKEMSVEWSEQVSTIAALKQQLVHHHGRHWAEALHQPNLVHALNQRVVSADAPVKEGDEVAFFPPMTGG